MSYNYLLKFFKYFIHDKKAFCKYFILSIIVGILELFGVALTYPFINRLLSKERIDTTSIIIGLLIVLAFFSKNIFMIFYNYLQADFTKSCEANINKQFMHYFLFDNYNKISKIAFVKKIQIVGFLTPNVVNNYLVRVLNLNVNIFIFVLISAFLFAKFFMASCITLLFSIVLILVQTMFFKNKTGKISRLINKSNELMNQSINEPLLNIKSVKLFGAEQYFYSRYTERLNDYRKGAKLLQFYNSIPPYVTEPFIIIILLVLLAIISIQNISAPTALVASYALIVSAIFRLAPTLSRIQVNLTGINTVIPQVKELIGYYEELQINSFSPKEKHNLKLKSSIQLKNICFSYNDSLILNNINLNINKGDFIGIVGSSGVGKTTLADIIAGLLNPNSGEIIVDGISLTHNNSFMLDIGYIPQDYSIISNSIRENVALGVSDIDDNKVIEVLKQAQLYDFIVQNYEDGIYATPFIDSTGFSQGQKQRLAIARALYKNPDIIILDEATSSLDVKTEDEICEVLSALKGEKTIIAIAHRLSTIKEADHIILMKDSTIIAQGKFEKLFYHNEDFRTFVELNIPNFVN